MNAPAVSIWPVTASRAATASTKITRTLYSVTRKALAPDWICAAMRRMFSSPSGFCMMSVKSRNA